MRIQKISKRFGAGGRIRVDMQAMRPHTIYENK